jgi:molybdopterin converting factor small subunit
MGAAKTLTLELFGPARRLCGQKQVTIEIGAEGTLRHVVAALAEHFPQLIGSVIEPQNQLSESYIFNYDGRRTARSLDEIPEEGEPLLLLPVDAGG